MANINKPCRVRWFCPKCEANHEVKDYVGQCAAAAARLLTNGILMVAIYDETYAIMTALDRAEDGEPGTEIKPVGVDCPGKSP